MDKKYIVKNCPCFNEGHPDLRFLGECLDLTQAENDCCAEVTNCLIKQVIELCKDVSGYSDFAFGQRDKADEILQLFEIEEVNNNK